MKDLSLFLIRAYQSLLGPFFGGNCRFYPSCSHYAAEAIERHGARRGSSLALRRLLRCHPFSPGGVDLVPEKSGLRAGMAAREESTEKPPVRNALTVTARPQHGPRQHPGGEFAR